jgi:hypothetical protein
MKVDINSGKTLGLEETLEDLDCCFICGKIITPFEIDALSPTDFMDAHDSCDKSYIRWMFSGESYGHLWLESGKTKNEDRPLST